MNVYKCLENNELFELLKKELLKHENIDMDTLFQYLRGLNNE